MLDKIRRKLDSYVSLRDVIRARDFAVLIGALAAYRSFRSMWRYFHDLRDVSKYDSGPDLIIICPDDGKQVAFKKRCPKCGGNSWMIAGVAGGIHNHMSLRHRKWLEIEEQQEELAPVVVLHPRDEDEQINNAGALA